MDFNGYIPTRVLFGAGCLNDLHTQIMPGKKAMLDVRQFTKNRIAKQGGIYENLIVILLLWWKYAPCCAAYSKDIGM